MPLHEFLRQDAFFGPDDLAVMSAAFDEALRRLGLKDRTDKDTELVTLDIISLAKLGERAPRTLCERRTAWMVSGEYGLFTMPWMCSRSSTSSRLAVAITTATPRSANRCAISDPVSPSRSRRSTNAKSGERASASATAAAA